uniref:Uncharacterized protein n=1 Tax=Anguilla anguilla TaxID=7936 RepID=A0A0E9XMK5_ANGAN
MSRFFWKLRKDKYWRTTTDLSVFLKHFYPFILKASDLLRETQCSLSILYILKTIRVCPL